MNLSTLCITLSMVMVAMVSGYSSGPGRCIGNRAAVGGLHILRRKFFFQSRKVVSKAYDDAGIVVRIGLLLFATPGNDYTLKTNTAYSITVTGNNIKGLLIRAQAPIGVNAKQTMTAGENTQIAFGCDTTLRRQTITGISHKDSSQKSSLKGTIQFNEEADVNIDVTVVFQNDYWKGASHAYGRFKLKFKDGLFL